MFPAPLSRLAHETNICSNASGVSALLVTVCTALHPQIIYVTGTVVCSVSGLWQYEHHKTAVQ